jgi:hypothetical protein
MTADAATTSETDTITECVEVDMGDRSHSTRLGELPSLDKRFSRPTLRRAARAGRWQPASVVREGEARKRRRLSGEKNRNQVGDRRIVSAGEGAQASLHAEA